MASDIDLSQRLPCNSTMQAFVDQAVQLNTPHEQLNETVALSAGFCQFSSNSTLAEEAKKIWLKSSAYGYVPSRAFAVFAMLAFGLAGILHIYQLVRSRPGSFVAVLFGLGLEVYGWEQRFEAGKDILSGYTEQLATLTVAPTFFSAVVYSLFSMLVASEDPTLLPRFKPRTYMWLFIGIDSVTLLIQIAAGVIAGGTGQTDVFESGCHIMLVGIILQLITTFVFLGVFFLYYTRLVRRRPDASSVRKGKGRIFYGMCLITALIIVRGFYRTFELGAGLFGKLASKPPAVGQAHPLPPHAERREGRDRRRSGVERVGRDRGGEDDVTREGAGGKAFA